MDELLVHVLERFDPANLVGVPQILSVCTVKDEQRLEQKVESLTYSDSPGGTWEAVSLYK